jgi:broad specificity phosphatase PhoE
MKVYFIRHGESEANLEQRHSGWTQVHLTDKGKEDARRAGEILKDVDFDRVFTSDLIRAMETQGIAKPEVEAEVSELIREIHVGHLGGRFKSDCFDEYGDEYIANRDSFEYKPYGGESYQEFCARVDEFKQQLEALDCERVAVFCHGGVINTFLELVLGDRTDRTKIACSNGSVSVFEYKKLSWRLLLWNYTGKI